MQKSICCLLLLLSICGCSDKITEGTMDEATTLRKKENYSDAVAIYRYQATQKNNTEAMYYLGAFYHEGAGVSRDMREAYNWFLKSAKGGFADAYSALGSMNVNGVHEIDANGNEITWLRCHPAIVTCDNMGVDASVWWYAKSVASGKKDSIRNIMFAYNYDQQKMYAWGLLAINQGLDISSYKDDMDSFKKHTSEDSLKQAEEWGHRLISLYGK